jgi:hypothetical protein
MKDDSFRRDEIFRYGVKNELRPKMSLYYLKRFYKTKICLNILVILLLCAAFLVIGLFIPNCQKCLVCPECLVCQQCQECSCPEQEKEIVISYICPDGTNASNSDDCELPEPDKLYVCEDDRVVESADKCKEDLELDTKYANQDNQMLLAVDDIRYDMKEDNWGTITEISYIVKNFAEYPVLPEIRVTVYNESDEPETKTYLRHTIKPNKTIEKDEFIQSIEDVHISFSGTNITAKFVLINGFDEVPLAKVVLERPLDNE